MRIAEKAGITRYMAMLFRPAARLLFKGLDLNGKAFRLICMNVTANILGLGNAATPLGIEAMKELEKTHISEGGDPLRASDDSTNRQVMTNERCRPDYPADSRTYRPDRSYKKGERFR